MNSNHDAPRPSRIRSTRIRRASASAGFTLIELLVVMVVIAILAAVSMAGLYASQEAAKEAKTKSTITKLHNQLMLRWETYRTRRLSVIMTSNDRIKFAKKKLNALWELMRIEMPDNYNDLAFMSSNNALRAAYLAFLRSKGVTPSAASAQNAGAECLYMMITLGMNDGEEIHFMASEIGDTDEDGIPEFLDGWGRPIRFLRWAPGYVPRLGADTDFQVDDPQKQPDPFDPLHVNSNGFKLVPLIYSAGPDGEYGIYDSNGPTASNPYYMYRDLDPAIQPFAGPQNNRFWRGAPLLGLEGGGHMDNITNHRLGER